MKLNYWIETDFGWKLPQSGFFWKKTCLTDCETRYISPESFSKSNNSCVVIVIKYLIRWSKFPGSVGGTKIEGNDFRSMLSNISRLNSGLTPPWTTKIDLSTIIAKGSHRKTSVITASSSSPTLSYLFFTSAEKPWTKRIRIITKSCFQNRVFCEACFFFKFWDHLGTRTCLA